MSDHAQGDPNLPGSWGGHNVLPVSPDPAIPPIFPTNVESSEPIGESQPTLEQIYAKLTPEHAAHLTRLLVSQRRAPKIERQKELALSANTDTNGNLILSMYTCPSGFEVQLTRLDMAFRDATTYNPSSPYAAAGSYAFIARLTPGQFMAPYAAADIAAIYTSLVTFAPINAAGPFIPGQWSYGNHQAPLFRDGQALFLVIVGAAAIANKSLTINLRFREYQA